MVGTVENYRNKLRPQEGVANLPAVTHSASQSSLAAPLHSVLHPVELTLVNCGRNVPWLPPSCFNSPWEALAVKWGEQKGLDVYLCSICPQISPQLAVCFPQRSQICHSSCSTLSWLSGFQGFSSCSLRIVDFLSSCQPWGIALDLVVALHTPHTSVNCYFIQVPHISQSETGPIIVFHGGPMDTWLSSDELWAQCW